MRLVLTILAALFLALGLAALYEAVIALGAFRGEWLASESGARNDFLRFAVQISIMWAFTTLYFALAWALWRQRRLKVVIFFLFVPVVALWMGVGYFNGFLLSLITLAVLLAKPARTLFRD